MWVKFFRSYIITANEIQMDPAKVSSVADWPNPESWTKTQQFMDFENFYRKFIRNFSSVVYMHSPPPRQLFSWAPRLRKSVSAFRKGSPQHWFWGSRPPVCSLKCGWAYLTSALGQCCLRGLFRSDHLTRVEYAHNTLPLVDTGLSPFCWMDRHAIFRRLLQYLKCQSWKKSCQLILL